MTRCVVHTGRPALDFVNTSAGGGESLVRPVDLAAWIAAQRLAPEPPQVTDDDLAAALALRHVLRTALGRRDRKLVAREVARWLHGTPGRLVVDLSTLDWRFIPSGTSTCCLMVPVALDALLLARDAADRVRECASERCDALYLDTSRNRSRRWCSMERCGARAKASAYYQRHRAGE